MEREIDGEREKERDRERERQRDFRRQKRSFVTNLRGGFDQ